MGLAQHPDRMTREMTGEPADTVEEVRATIRENGGVRRHIVADSGPPQVRLLRRLVRQRTFETVQRLMDMAELAAESPERWAVCRRQMLTSSNTLVEELVDLISTTLGLSADQLPEEIGKEQT